MLNLPYELSPGVWALERGLRFDHGLLREFMRVPLDFDYCEFLLKWPDAAKQLQYREGEPWCLVDSATGWINCGWWKLEKFAQSSTLHRRAAILCNDAEGFSVLYECIGRYSDAQ